MEFIFTYARNIWVRSLFTLGMYVCAVFLPWWISAIVCFVGIVLFKMYFEGVIWAVYIEGAYMYTEQFPVVLVLTAIAFVIMHIIRSRLVFARNERYEL